MTNTFIEPGDVSFDEMLADVKEGVYAKNWYGGTTSMEMFTFSAGEAYMIRNGKIAELLRPVTLSGNVFTTLQNIDAIGDDLEMNQAGDVGRESRFPFPFPMVVPISEYEIAWLGEHDGEDSLISNETCRDGRGLLHLPQRDPRGV